MKIEACFDSHVHWPLTGEWAERLKLDGLKTPVDVRDLRIETPHRRGEWIVGFGWDATPWLTPPHREHLDTVFGSTPVAFSRCDAHALWVNTEALRRANLLNFQGEIPGGRIERDAQGLPTGVLIDAAAEKVRDLIPRASGAEVRRRLLKGAKVFNQAGITHIRDMTCDEVQWHEALKLDQSGLLTLAVEEYFWLKSLSHWPDVLKLVNDARASASSNLRAKGLKVFMDGALGSEGAYLSKCYHGRDHRGLLLWTLEDLKETLRLSAAENLEVAVHVIGDEAADMVVNVAAELKQNNVAVALHLEHCELLRAETVRKMRGLNIVCHLQPSHWLTDRAWLERKVGDLSENAFPWRRLQEAEVPFHFGSDSPIEPADIGKVFQAIEESAENGIPRLLGSANRYLSHPDLAWAPNSFTQFSDLRPTEVLFRGENIL